MSLEQEIRNEFGIALGKKTDSWSQETWELISETWEKFKSERLSVRKNGTLTRIQVEGNTYSIGWEKQWIIMRHWNWDSARRYEKKDKEIVIGSAKSFMVEALLKESE